jgi:DNA-binding NtrC family response regulator
MANERVLLVDDEAEFTEILSQRMKSRGVDVDTAASGREALEKVKAESYDAVILDLLMPEMGGMETLRHLLATSPGLQVILLTAHATLETGVEAIKLGAVDFLEKPAEIHLLMERIRQANASRMLLVQQQAAEKIKAILETRWW